MTKLAIIQTGGKQYLVKPNDKIQVEKLAGKEGETIELGEVLFTADGSAISIGKPVVAGAKVQAKIIKQGRGKKLVVFKYKAKSKYRRKQGHRQHFTEVEVQKF